MDDQAPRHSASPADGHPILWRYLPAALIAVALALAYAAGWADFLTLDTLAQSRAALKAFATANPVLAPAGFVMVYALAAALAFPAASVLTIFGGFLFGWLLGGTLAVVAATIGATTLFLAARTAFGDFLRRYAGKTAARLADGFAEDAFVYLLVLRLAPFIPFVVVNIAPALFNVRVRTFVGATAIGILPGAFAYAWLGQGVDSVLTAAARAGRDVTVSDLVTPQISIAFAALALVAVVAAVAKRWWAARTPSAGVHEKTA